MFSTMLKQQEAITNVTQFYEQSADDRGLTLPSRFGRIGRMTLKVRILGPLEVEKDQPVSLDRLSHRRLLSALVLERGRALGTDALIDRLWDGEPPATAKATVHTHVSALRRVLGNSHIVTEGRAYRLAVESEDLDVARFATLAQEARTAARKGDWEEALEAAESALDLWRGEPFPDLVDDDFARPEITRLTEIYLELQELRADGLITTGRADDAVPRLEGLVIQHPLRERLWEHLMLARYRLGRHTEALRAYQTLRDHLAEIGLEPGHRLSRLEEKILFHERSLSETRHNLPDELSSFIGRRDEISVVSELVQDRRLTTLTGAGGSGKTRLAVQVARHVLDSFPDGIWMVELASIDEPDRIAVEIALTMGLRPRGEQALTVLTQVLETETVLIIFDNCEHLLEDAASMVQHILQSSPNVKILATSREPLRVPGEAIYQVPGMSFPIEKTSDPAVALLFDAVQLFRDRAEQSNLSFDLDETNLPGVLNICSGLDGIPLAIELAAARTRAMDVRVIADRLDDRLQLLTAGASTAHPRQETLQATIEWSYRLLDHDEKAALNRLSVFRGGFAVDAAEEVVADDQIESRDVARLLSDLIDKSLVTTFQSPSGARLRLLESVRQYAEMRLTNGGDEAPVRNRHLSWSLSKTDRLWARTLGGERRDVSTTLALEADNLQAAFEHALSRYDNESVVRLSHALGWHWYFTGHLGTAADVLRSGLEVAEDRADICLSRALMAWCFAYSEDLENAFEEAEAAYDLRDEIQDHLTKTWVVTTLQLAHFMSVQADPAEMIPLATEATDIAQASGDTYAEILARQALADAYCWNGMTEEGLEQQRAALNLASATGETTTINQIYGLSIYNFMLDPVARRNNPLEVVKEWQLLVPFDSEAWATIATDWLPWVYLQSGDFDRAEEAVTRLGDRTQQGYNRTIHLIVRSTLSWMRGALDSAWEDLETLGSYSENPRWAHTHYPLVAEVAADLGRLDEVRRVAEAYVHMRVHTTREATKLGVLYPLVRAEVDSAIGTGSRGNSEGAKEALQRMQTILRDHPPQVDSWLSIMTHTQNLAFAEAEITRLSGPRPERWSNAVRVADYAYYRIYALWRLGEALMESGDLDNGLTALRRAYSEAEGVGADLMSRRATATANQYDATLV